MTAMSRASRVILLLQLVLTAILVALVTAKLWPGALDADSYLGAAAFLCITVAVLAAVRLLMGNHSQHLDSRL